MGKGYFQTEDEVKKQIKQVIKNFKIDIEVLNEGIEDVEKEIKKMDFDHLVELYNKLVEEEKALSKLIKGD